MVVLLRFLGFTCESHSKAAPRRAYAKTPNRAVQQTWVCSTTGELKPNLPLSKNAKNREFSGDWSKIQYLRKETFDQILVEIGAWARKVLCAPCKQCDAPAFSSGVKRWGASCFSRRRAEAHRLLSLHQGFTGRSEHCCVVSCTICSLWVYRTNVDMFLYRGV